MPEELEARLLRGYDAWNRRDFDALSDLFHPDVEIDATNRVLNPARYQGLDGLRQLTDETFDTWDAWSIEPTRFRWNGNRVLVETKITAQAKGQRDPADRDLLHGLHARGRQGGGDGDPRRLDGGVRVGRGLARDRIGVRDGKVVSRGHRQLWALFGPKRGNPPATA